MSVGTLSTRPNSSVISSRATEGGEFKLIGMQVPGINRYTDYLGQSGKTTRYKVCIRPSIPCLGVSNESAATTHEMTDDELLTMLQGACFRYYWEGAHPASGTSLENIPGDDRIVATGRALRHHGPDRRRRPWLHHPRARPRPSA